MTIEVAGQVFLVVLAAVGLAAGVTAYFQAQKAKATIEIQGETIEAQRQRLDEYAAASVDRDRQVAQLTGRLTAAENENRLLRDMVTGKDALTNLTTLVMGLQASQDQILEALRRQR